MPQTEEELSLTADVWLNFFGRVQAQEVTKTIMAIAAEGAEFAPQVGQIYSRLKNNRKSLPAADAEYARACRVLAEIMEIPEPHGDCKSWFAQVKNTPLDRGESHVKLD